MTKASRYYTPCGPGERRFVPNRSEASKPEDQGQDASATDSEVDNVQSKEIGLPSDNTDDESDDDYAFITPPDYLYVLPKESLLLCEGWLQERLPSGQPYLINKIAKKAYRLSSYHNRIPLVELGIMAQEITPDSSEYTKFPRPTELQLPQGWLTHENASGETIYTDPSTGNTYHDHPALLLAVKAQEMSEPSEWEPRFAHKTLYYAHRTLPLNYPTLDTFDGSAVLPIENWRPYFGHATFSNVVTGSVLRNPPWLAQCLIMLPNFIEVRTTVLKDGSTKRYYANHQTKENSWEHPILADLAKRNYDIDNAAFQSVTRGFEILNPQEVC